MHITVNDELRGTIDPLTTNEYTALERSLLAEGCRDALVLWGDILIDGHNRYAICQQHGIAFNTVQNTSFGTIADVMLWMIDNHLARRSVSDFQRGVLALRKKDIVTARHRVHMQDAPVGTPAIVGAPITTRDDVARLAGISSNTITRIEKIQKGATPELVEAVRAGTISINAAAEVSTLPAADQVAAVAGGKKELQQAAKQVREMKAGTRPARTPVPEVDAVPPVDTDALQARVLELTVQNAALIERVVVLTAALETARHAA
ncbi:hypothetical protein QN362_15775 [Actimicrobium sp. CCC2.4]|uniref:hypothetical protein n=1 Tax=Actimicrobium sp. CCC2.4 TaxID=3048606 RepID=UPI002AC9042C|nr:hypothetical protein [Actimicrobium sp. CCC2.4]MEB0136797.1 hypothetical protein [Actimicrobium sp. CCC2.4]WPX33925.1 hypothetical protein RHM62_09000 [Actimicrobium sp. CCC2.4]